VTPSVTASGDINPKLGDTTGRPSYKHTAMQALIAVGDLLGMTCSDGVMMRMMSVVRPGPAAVTACIQN